MEKQTEKEAANDYAACKTRFRRDILKEVDNDSFDIRFSDCKNDFLSGVEWQKKQNPLIEVIKNNNMKNMDQTLTEETKKAIGYTDEQKVCENCKYASEWEDQGGLWNWTCNYSNICSFSIKKYAHCNKFERKKFIPNKK